MAKNILLITTFPLVMTQLQYISISSTGTPFALSIPSINCVQIVKSRNEEGNKKILATFDY